MANNYNDHNNLCDCSECKPLTAISKMAVDLGNPTLSSTFKHKRNISKEQLVEWLKEYGLHNFLQYPYKPTKGMSVGHMVRYPEDLAQFLMEKLNNELLGQ